MKPLARLNNVEKARLLFQLFPDTIPDLLVTQKAIADNLDRDPTQLDENWSSDVFTPAFWVSLARQSKGILEKYGVNLSKSSRLFADQLFDGYNALFSMYCMKIFAKKNQKERYQFSQIVNAFF